MPRALVAVLAFVVAMVFVPFELAPRAFDELDRSSVPSLSADPTAEVGSAGPANQAGRAGDPAVPEVELAARPVPQGVAASPTAAPSPPIEVRLASIGVRSGLEHLALQGDGSIAAPVDFDSAGWFEAGPAPGQPGPAVIAGHVDSQRGPAVFYRLSELQPGDPVEVQRADGLVVRFRVTRVEQHPKDAFPTESVYGPVPGPELRLITCGGEFDRATGHYRSNIVVFAVAA